MRGGLCIFASLCVLLPGSRAALQSPQQEEAAFLSENSESGTGLSQRIKHEIREVSDRVHSLLSDHPAEQHKVGGLLHQASRMAERAAQSQSLAQQAREHLSLLVENSKDQSRTNSSAASTTKTAQEALLGFASGLAKASEADKELFREARTAKRAVQELVGTGERGAEAAHLLQEVQQDERKMVISEAHEARDAERAALKLNGRTHQASSSSTDQRGQAKSADAALAEYTSGLAKVAAADRRILSETTQLEGALKDDSASPESEALQRLREVEQLERRVLRDEGRQASNVRQLAAHRRQAPEQSLRQPQRAAPQPHGYSTKMQQLKHAYKLSNSFAQREARLAEVDQSLALRVQDMSHEAAAELRAGGHADQEAVEMLWEHLSKARDTVHQLAAFHGHLATEAKDRAARLLTLEQRLRQETSSAFAQQETRNKLRAVRMQAAQRAAAQLRRGRKVFAETLLAEDAVQGQVRGSAEANKVRKYVTRALHAAEKVEERQMALAAKSLRRAHHHHDQ